MFRHRILDSFQDYPPFQSATKSSFSDLCYFSRCHAHKTNKLQVERLLSTCSLFWLCFLLAAHGNTRLTAVITGEQSQRVIPRCHFFGCRGGQRFQRCHLIAIFLPVHGLQRHLVTGLQIGQPAEVPLVIMSRNDQIFRIGTAGIAADSIRCLFIANSHYNCRGEPYSSSLQWFDLFFELFFTESHPKAACQAHCGDHQ